MRYPFLPVRGTRWLVDVVLNPLHAQVCSRSSGQGWPGTPNTQVSFPFCTDAASTTNIHDVCSHRGGCSASGVHLSLHQAVGVRHGEAAVPSGAGHGWSCSHPDAAQQRLHTSGRASFFDQSAS